MNSLLTPRQVAQSLGVSESSLKRWCDRGDLPFQRTAGGHRRIPVKAVVRFLRENQREVIRPEILGLPVGTHRHGSPLGRSVTMLSKALIQGDAVNSRRIVLEFFLAGNSLATISDDLITPALAIIGDRWQCREVEVFEEHRAVEIIVRILHEFRMTIESSQARSRTAIGGTLEGDLYGLPTRMVELVLLDMGWAATSLGTSLPLDTLLCAIDQVRPQLFWLSISIMENEQTFLNSLSAFCRQVPSTTEIVLGGRALTSDIREGIRRAACFENLQQLTVHLTQRAADVASAT